MAKMVIGTEEVKKIMFGTEEVSSLAIGGETVPVDGGDDYSKMPLTFEVLSGGNITLSSNGNIERKVNYSVNDGEATTLEFTSAANKTYTITVEAGDVVEFTVPEDQNGLGETISKYISIAGKYISNIYGNILSLCYVDYQSNSSIPNDYCFYRLFRNNKVVSAENLVLPEVLMASCLSYLFGNCTNLTTAPKILPAITAVYNCYGYMFQGCTSLVNAPELPATTLAQNCYSYMFQGCTSLTTAPELHATGVRSYSYGGMFSGCTSLTAAPELPAKLLGSSCYSYMFQGCTSLTTAPELPAETIASACYANMFQGCTSLTTAPELPAKTLESNCYQNMFQGCTSLTTAPELHATGVRSYSYGGMFSGCTNLNYIKCLNTKTTEGFYSNWVTGVSATGTFVKAAGVTWPTGISGIPDGWTVEEV